eukprot:gene1880-2125_t
MSDIEEETFSFSTGSDISDLESDSDKEYGIVRLGGGVGLPHEDEPLARANMDGIEDEEEDKCDGITAEQLEARFESKYPVDKWCTCGQCHTDLLSGAREYRCCREILEADGKLIFDGSIERISCVTLHEDFCAITNTTNLTQVGPLLKDKTGRPYKQRGGQTRNQ